MLERNQVLHESLLNFKVEGSWSEMASIGKAGNIETALQGHGDLHGSGCHIGISFCIHAGTVEHVENYSNYLWVHRTPLPMGLHCQNPLFIGEKSPKGPRAPSTVADPSVLPDGPPCTAGASTSAPSMGKERQMQMLLPYSLNSCCETHASRLMPWGSCLKTQDSLPIPLCSKEPVRHNIVSHCFIHFAAFLTS